MRLSDILTVERVRVAADVDARDDALGAVAQLFATANPKLPAAEVRRVLIAREDVQSTAFGNGVAIPHGRMRDMEGIACALLVTTHGIDFHAVDNLPVRIVLALLAPEHHTADHLKALARLSRLVRDERSRQRILDAASADDALKIVSEEDERH